MANGTTRVAEFRRIIHDTAAPYRIEEADALRLLNEALQLLYLWAPFVFRTTESFTLTDGAVQTKPIPHTPFFLILRTENLRPVTPVAFKAISNTDPQWMNAEPGETLHQVLLDHPTEFYVYPQAQAGDSITIEYAKPLTPLSTLSDEVGLPEQYSGLLPYVMAHLHYLPDTGEEANLTLAMQHENWVKKNLEGGAQ